jgi:hypothetical protein
VDHTGRNTLDNDLSKLKLETRKKQVDNQDKADGRRPVLSFPCQKGPHSRGGGGGRGNGPCSCHESAEWRTCSSWTWHAGPTAAGKALGLHHTTIGAACNHASHYSKGYHVMYEEPDEPEELLHGDGQDEKWTQQKSEDIAGHDWGEAELHTSSLGRVKRTKPGSRSGELSAPKLPRPGMAEGMDTDDNEQYVRIEHRGHHYYMHTLVNTAEHGRKEDSPVFQGYLKQLRCPKVRGDWVKDSQEYKRALKDITTDHQTRVRAMLTIRPRCSKRAFCCACFP